MNPVISGLFGLSWIDGLFSVFDGGLSDLVRVEEIRHVFSKFGRVIDIHISSIGGKRRSFAFVRYLLAVEA